VCDEVLLILLFIIQKNIIALLDYFCSLPSTLHFPNRRKMSGHAEGKTEARFSFEKESGMGNML